MRARLVLWFLALACVVGALSWSELRSSSGPKERADRLAAAIRCPDCEGLSAADSFTSSARAIRHDIAARVARGESDDEIRDAYANRFGESILLDPAGDGLGLLVWGLPVVAILLGGGALVLTLRRWRTQPMLHASAADEELVARERLGRGPVGSEPT